MAIDDDERRRRVESAKSVVEINQDFMSPQKPPKPSLHPVPAPPSERETPTADESPRAKAAREASLLAAELHDLRITIHAIRSEVEQMGREFRQHVVELKAEFREVTTLLTGVRDLVSVVRKSHEG